MLYQFFLLTIAYTLIPTTSYRSQNDISVRFQEVVDFEIEQTVAASSKTTTSTEAKVDSSIVACKCDNLESFSCNNTAPLYSDSTLYVCIQSMDPDIEIDSITKLELKKTDVNDLTIIEYDPNSASSKILNDNISYEVGNVTKRGVATIVPSRFFTSDSSTTAANVTGSIKVKLTGGRRLESPDKSESTITNVAMSRTMLGKSIFRPGYGNDVTDEPATDVTSTDTNFEITIGLERETIEIETVEIPRVVSSSQNSGFGKVAGNAHFIGAMAYLLWTFFW